MSRDSEMIGDPSRWSQWPFLPLKRGDPAGHEELGVLMAGTSKVLLGNVFSPVKELLKSPAIVYDSPQAIVDDGWTVD